VGCLIRKSFHWTGSAGHSCCLTISITAIHKFKLRQSMWPMQGIQVLGKPNGQTLICWLIWSRCLSTRNALHQRTAPSTYCRECWVKLQTLTNLGSTTAVIVYGATLQITYFWEQLLIAHTKHVQWMFSICSKILHRRISNKKSNRSPLTGMQTGYLDAQV
jgi:hypothetical protein